MKLPIKNPVFWFWLFSFSFIFYGTLIPFDFTPPAVPFAQRFQDLITLKSLAEHTHLSKMDVISNVLLFIPFGFFSSLLMRQARINSFFVFISVPFMSVLVSTTVEILQFYSPERVSSLFDIVINTLGGFTGTLLALLIFGFFNNWIVPLWNKLLHQKIFILITLIYGFILFMGALVPFDISIQISDLKEAVKNIHFIPFSSVGDVAIYKTSLIRDGLLFALFSFLCHFSMRLYTTHKIPFFIISVLLTLFLSVCIEFSQLFIVSRNTDTTDIVIALIGSIAGSGIALQIERIIMSSVFSRLGLGSHSFSFLKLFFLIGYGWFLFYFLMAPLNFTFSLEEARQHLSWHHLIPFYAYWARTDFYALKDLVFTLLLYVPLGAILKANFLPLKGARIWAVFSCLIFASLMEGLQFFQPGRVPDITDVLSGLTGGWIGIWLIGSISAQRED